MIATKSKRCNMNECRKKLKLTDFKCRCNMIFCSKHRYPEEHDCNFNYKYYTEEILKKNNPKINSNKLEML